MTRTGTHAGAGRRDRLVVAFATLASLALGLTFVFVRSPLPWGWEGIDQYHERALSLASGHGFPTMDVPIGYALFLAGWYRVFGDHPVVPIVAQVLLNALMPLLVYCLVRLVVADGRTAALAALLVGVFSFNTVYASTQVSDAVCNVLFVAGMLALALGATGRQLHWCVLAGGLFGAAAQFRPNLLLFPIVAAGIIWFQCPARNRRAARAMVLLVTAAIVGLPWTIRNYRMTGEIIPVSTHGAVQLWYGTLQTGPYLHSRVYNPRSLFEEWPFAYSSIADRSIVIGVPSTRCPEASSAGLRLTWWSDRHPERIDAAPMAAGSAGWTFEIPGQPAPTTVYYAFSSPAPIAACAATPDRPGVYFITRDLLDDPDRHGDLLDVFDVARLAGHLTWGDPVPFADRLDADHDGDLDEHDLRAVVASLLAGRQPEGVEPLAIVSSVDRTGDRAAVRFVDGSILSVPRGFSGRYTAVDSSWKLAYLIRLRVRPMADLTAAADLAHPTPIELAPVRAAEINQVFYRDDPHSMHRYTALALDNIRHDPVSFAQACLYRAYRVFVVNGGIDEYTVKQFRGSAIVYALAHAVSLTYFLLFLAGVGICVWRRRLPLVLLVPPVYVAATIAPVLTNMRYSLTTQPFVLTFAAIALLAGADAARRARGASGPADAPVLDQHV